MSHKSTFTEQELVSQLKSNNREAFEYLYDRYSSALYGIILKIIKDEEKAADVMQDVFLKIWKNISSYNSEKGTLFTWILNVARNTAIDKLRMDVKMQLNVSWDAVKEIELTPGAIFTPTPSTIDIRAIVELLLPERKLLIDMVYFQGYTHEEVSEKLSIPLGTVKSRIRKSLQELRGVFGVNTPVFQLAS
ncbi:RNA polymerase sigma factor [Dyadobacter psychrotolerans]|uniref:Sigma-70 family RNA polymerase sigma factor n=1 Tax=Dyadobacter psychrotolerans TaxID=2541721 RepID=A0A4R5DVF3_9BACT|nr:sigma-70 family RNA polymerase sigma factor [Dyadobacter psychrotolerans]TDE18522.1 sigma-70 family RNA polymerase sigma factor [Dyadobacter psychrotolerans]